MEDKQIKNIYEEDNTQTLENGNDTSINNLIDLMNAVNVDTEEAILNETTISDGMGGRILL